MGTFRVACLAVLLAGCSGQGCSGVGPLPDAPAPLGFPPGQQIEGGMLIRLTAAGVQHVGSTLTPTVDAALGSLCLPPISFSAGVTCFETQATLCGHADCPGGAMGCPVHVQPIGALQATAASTGTPSLVLTSTFDATMDVPVDFSISAACVTTTGSCPLTVASNHLSDPTQPPLGATTTVALTIDPTSGLTQASVTGVTLDLSGVGGSGCAGLGAAVPTLVSSLQSGLTTLLVPTLDATLQGILPEPAGFAGVFRPAQPGSERFPPDTSLELLAVLGGRVVASGGGLSLGLLAGANSDRDPSTRDGAAASEPAACVAGFPSTLDLGSAPWNLPFNPQRQDYVLGPPGELEGTPEPLLPDGGVADFAWGLSWDVVELLASHAASGGLLCYQPADGGVFTRGALLTLADLDGPGWDAYQALAGFSLRPGQPLEVALGTGDAGETLLHLALHGLGADISLQGGDGGVPVADVSLDLALETVQAPSGLALEPVLTGMQVTGTGTLQQALAGAAELLAGTLATPVALAPTAGLGVQALELRRVQSSQGEFLVLEGALGPSPATRPTVDAVGAVGAVTVPRQDALRLGAAGVPDGGIPSVQLLLAGDGGTEWSVRIDGAPWRGWSDDPAPVLTDPLLYLQGHHVIEVRARVRGELGSLGTTPLRLEVLLDSVPPTLQPALDPANRSLIAFNARDFVSPPEAMQYAWSAGDAGAPFGPTGTLQVSEAVAATSGGKLPLVVFARDEAGNVGQANFDVSILVGNTGGCGCASSPGATVFPALGLLVLLGLGRRRPRPPPDPGRA